MDFREFLKTNRVYLDGGMGTMLQANGLQSGEVPEEWNVSHPQVVQSIHKAYYEAGSNVVSTNTFGANCLKMEEERLQVLIRAATKNAKAARAAANAPQEKFIALDIGPTGKLLEPFGELSFEKAVEVFAKTVRLGVANGVDLIIIETMSDSYETKAAVLAAKENSTLPILVSNAYGGGDRLMMGACPETMATILEGLGVDAFGANCSFGPKQLMGVAEKLLKSSSLPILIKPNAGLPHTVDGKAHYDVDAAQFATDVTELMRGGINIVGGCCGTTPEHIAALHQATANLALTPRDTAPKTRIATGNSVFELTDDVSIGNLCASDNQDFADALSAGDIDAIVDEAMDLQDDGAEILKLNVCTDGINEAQVYKEIICHLQSMISLPLCFESENVAALETALRHYNGKALVSAPKDASQLQQLLPLIKKYGGVLLVKEGDQETPLAAQAFGIPSHDIFII